MGSVEGDHQNLYESSSGVMNVCTKINENPIPKHVEIFESGQKWWTDQLTFAVPGAKLQAWLKM